MKRIILGASPAQVTALLQEIQLKLGEVRQEIGTGAATQQATAVGAPGSSLLAAPDSHVHPYAMASGGIIQGVSTSTSTGGQSPYFCRGDHIHFFNFAGKYGSYASNISISTSSGGLDSSVSRADHIHYLNAGSITGLTGNVNYAVTATIQAAAGMADAGTHTTVARGDHVHNLPFAATATLCNVAWAAGNAGTATDVARGDHVHRVLPGTRNMMSGSRTTSTIYTNNGTGPMYIGISLALSSPGAEGAHLQIGGTDVAHGDANANIHFFLMGIANPGEQYLLTATGGVHIDHWMEYGF